MPKQSSKLGRHNHSTVLGRRAFEAISAVEGLKLSSAGRKRVSGNTPVEQRRAEVLRAYTDIKGRK